MNRYKVTLGAKVNFNIDYEVMGYGEIVEAKIVRDGALEYVEYVVDAEHISGPAEMVRDYVERNKSGIYVNVLLEEITEWV